MYIECDDHQSDESDNENEIVNYDEQHSRRISRSQRQKKLKKIQLVHQKQRTALHSQVNKELLGKYFQT